MAHNSTELLKPLYHDKTVTHETQLQKDLVAKEDNAQLWMCLVVKLKFDAIKTLLRNL